MRIVSWQQLDLQLIAATFSRLLHLLSPPSNAAFLTAISPSAWITLSKCLDGASLSLVSSIQAPLPAASLLLRESDKMAATSHMHNLTTLIKR